MGNKDLWHLSYVQVRYLASTTCLFRQCAPPRVYFRIQARERCVVVCAIIYKLRLRASAQHKK